MKLRRHVTRLLGASFFLMFGVSLGVGTASAQCSAVTGPGMSARGPCPTQRQYNYPAPSGGSGGGTSYRGGGGDGNAGAAIGAADAALGVLGVLIDAARESEQNDQSEQDAARDADARRQLAARLAYCRRNWQQASNEIQTGNSVMDHWNPGGAMPHFERAIALLSPCDDRNNIAIARHNLDLARQRYAAVKDDNRVADAVDRYGKSNPYASNSPFAAPAADVSTASEQDAASDGMAKSIVEKATNRCSYAPPGSVRWQSCKLTQEARLIMDADAEISGACRLENGAVARDSCAVKSYVDKLQRAKAGDKQNCYFDKNGQPCITDTGTAPGASTARPKQNSLREDLRARLARKAADDASSQGATTAPSVAVPSTTIEAAADKQAQPAAKSDGALEAYLSGQNGSTGTRNDGNLNTTDFRMDAAGTRREIDRLTKP